MLKRFEVRNYRCFKDSIVMDFGKVGSYRFNQDCITDGLLSKAIIYGRNATGKTNLGHAIGDIRYVIGDMHRLSDDKIPLLNADSQEETAYFRYEFEFQSGSVIYEYSKNHLGELKREKVILNQKTLFAFDFYKIQFQELALGLIEADCLQVDKYINALSSDFSDAGDMEDAGDIHALPFLRFILNNTPLPSTSPLRELEFYVKRMKMSRVESPLWIGEGKFYARYLGNRENLLSFQDYLTQMGVPCSLCVLEEPDGNQFLYFKKSKLVPFFKTASSGTLALTRFYFQYIAGSRDPSFFFLDEFDAFYHYEMSENLVRYLKRRFPRTQIVLTTHNTNLMTNYLMRPDSLLVLSRDGRLTALCDATERELREGHNLEKLYIAGEFESYE